MFELARHVLARLGQLPAGAVFGAAFAYWTQTVWDSTTSALEKGIGWSIIVAASVYAVRLVVRTTERMDARVLETIERYRADLEAERARNNELEAEKRELAVELRDERQLRLSLEQQGLRERRHPPDLT